MSFLKFSRFGFKTVVQNGKRERRLPMYFEHLGHSFRLTEYHNFHQPWAMLSVIFTPMMAAGHPLWHRWRHQWPSICPLRWTQAQHHLHLLCPRRYPARGSGNLIIRIAGCLRLPQARLSVGSYPEICPCRLCTKPRLVGSQQRVWRGHLRRDSQLRMGLIFRAVFPGVSVPL